MDKTIRQFLFGRDRSGTFGLGRSRIGIVKKLEKAGGDKENAPADNIGLDDVILAGLERGLTMADMRKMQIGQIVDFIIAYNDRQKAAENAEKRAEKRGKRRKGTQADINAFFG